MTHKERQQLVKSTPKTKGLWITAIVIQSLLCIVAPIVIVGTIHDIGGSNADLVALGAGAVWLILEIFALISVVRLNTFFLYWRYINVFGAFSHFTIGELPWLVIVFVEIYAGSVVLKQAGHIGFLIGPKKQKK